jgi:hypothetical protein
MGICAPPGPERARTARRRSGLRQIYGPEQEKVKNGLKSRGLSRFPGRFGCCGQGCATSETFTFWAQGAPRAEYRVADACGRKVREGMQRRQQSRREASLKSRPWEGHPKGSSVSWTFRPFRQRGFSKASPSGSSVSWPFRLRATRRSEGFAFRKLRHLADSSSGNAEYPGLRLPEALTHGSNGFPAARHSGVALPGDIIHWGRRRGRGGFSGGEPGLRAMRLSRSFASGQRGFVDAHHRAVAFFAAASGCRSRVAAIGPSLSPIAALDLNLSGPLPMSSRLQA